MRRVRQKDDPRFEPAFKAAEKLHALADEIGLSADDVKWSISVSFREKGSGLKREVFCAGFRASNRILPVRRAR